MFLEAALVCHKLLCSVRKQSSSEFFSVTTFFISGGYILFIPNLFGHFYGFLFLSHIFNPFFIFLYILNMLTLYLISDNFNISNIYYSNNFAIIPATYTYFALFLWVFGFHKCELIFLRVTLCGTFQGLDWRWVPYQRLCLCFCQSPRNITYTLQHFKILIWVFLSHLNNEN